MGSFLGVSIRAFIIRICRGLGYLIKVSSSDRGRFMLRCCFGQNSSICSGPSCVPCVWEARWEVLPSKSQEFAGLVVKVIQRPPANAHKWFRALVFRV